jgi:hypothetical protein
MIDRRPRRERNAQPIAKLAALFHGSAGVALCGEPRESGVFLDLQGLRS